MEAAVARKLTLDFLKTEAASGTVLGLAAVVALIVANSPLSEAYFHWLKSEQLFQAGPLSLELSISEWIKEGLMAVFFLVVGLEIKYEILKGELSDPKKLATPVIAALGGMVAPAGVYLLVTNGLAGPHQGWPIPLATDIAFALAVFALVGKGLPSSLRIFLLTLAIVDDLGAIALIAVLFSQGVDWMLVGGAAVLLAIGSIWSLRRVPAPFWVLGFALVWWMSVKAGLSTSLAAVAFAAIVPVTPRHEGAPSPLKTAMHDLHPYVAYRSPAPVRLRQGRSVLRRPVARPDARPPGDRRGGRPVRRQAAGRAGRGVAGDRAETGRTSQSGELVAALRGRSSLRRRFHHEPLHRRTRFSRARRFSRTGRGQAGCPSGLNVISDNRGDRPVGRRAPRCGSQGFVWGDY